MNDWLLSLSPFFVYWCSRGTCRKVSLNIKITFLVSFLLPLHLTPCASLKPSLKSPFLKVSISLLLPWHFLLLVGNIAPSFKSHVLPTLQTPHLLSLYHFFLSKTLFFFHSLLLNMTVLGPFALGLLFCIHFPRCLTLIVG